MWVSVIWLSHSVRWMGKSFAVPAMVLVGIVTSQPSLAQNADNQLGKIGNLNEISTGEQRVIDDHTGSIRFAGRDIQLNSFSGVVGYASQVAYIATTSGSVELDGKRANRGKMLLIPPFGQKTIVEKFDAKRLLASWDNSGKVVSQNVRTQLSDVATGQSRGVFLGRLGRTGFNIMTSGNASQELSRRSVIGGKTVRNLRFRNSEEQSDLDRQVIQKFVGALRAGNSQIVAELMDPVPFGGGDSNGQARSKMADMLVKEKNWAAILGSNLEIKINDDGYWTVNSSNARLILTLRSTPDFIFIKSVNSEEG